MFRVTQPYVNLLVKPRKKSGFLEKNIIECILKGEMPFKMHMILYFFSRKKNVIEKKCVPTLPNFPDPLTKTHLFFIWPYESISIKICSLNIFIHMPINMAFIFRYWYNHIQSSCLIFNELKIAVKQ